MRSSASSIGELLQSRPRKHDPLAAVRRVRPERAPAPLLVAGPREVLRRGAARQQPVPGPRRQLQRGPAEDPTCDRKLDEAPQRQGKIRLRYEIVCRMPIAT